MTVLDRSGRLDAAAFACLLGAVALVQFSIAAAEILLALAAVGWLAAAIARRDLPRVPALFWPLAAYAAWTLVAVVFSSSPRVSLSDARELLLFVAVPVTYRLAAGRRASATLEVIISVGAVSAAIGIIQYGILNYDHLGQRPTGTLGHYMTYSGTLMLVIGATAARLVFQREGRTWPALVMPALLVALALTFTRSAWVGACVAVGLLFVLKDFRLLAILPVVAAVFFALAPQSLTARVYSMFNLNDPTNRDRVAMMREGLQMIRDYPLTGVGPDMVIQRYAEYRDAEAVETVNPHLHNVPLQIAAERGLPALAAWLWFVVAAVAALWRAFRAQTPRALPAAGLAAVAGMLSAGLFEYNFGDSEFLILFLVLITLPFAAVSSKGQAAAPPATASGAHTG
jgi:O-antigen ligase